MDTPNNPVFDPMAWLAQKPSANARPSSTAANTQPTNTQPTKACQSLSHADELARATAVVRQLIDRNANIAEEYLDYVRLGFALANGLGSDGRDLYHMLCAHSTKYRMEDCERKWQECLSKADGRTSIATFYHMAREAGVDIKNMKR